MDSIELFNLRPDLDPGPLSKKQLEERPRRNKLRNTNVFPSYSEFERQRPRTPVYGMLRFRSPEGYRMATSAELRIFGCVIRRHPVPTVKTREVTTLYLEGVPSDLLAMDVECELAQLMHKRGLRVMQDGMQGVGRTNARGGGRVLETSSYQENAVPSSCQIKFEDYQAAYQTYQEVRDGNEDGDGARNRVSLFGGEECQVHWFRTPANSMAYWTRELAF